MQQRGRRAAQDQEASGEGPAVGEHPKGREEIRPPLHLVQYDQAP